MARTAIGVLLSCLGAAAGAAVGVSLFIWLIGQGLYALVLPAACMGMGANLASREKSTIRGAILAVIGVALSLVLEAKYFPFVADASYSYFFAHIQDLRPWTFVMIAVGSLFAFWWGREGAPWADRRSLGRSQPVQVKGRVERQED